MSKLEILSEAIRQRRPIRFQSRKSPGDRQGNPHAVYIFRSKAGVESTKVDIEQTAGVSSSGKPFPSFRMFDLDDLDSITVLEAQGNFSPSADYKPTSDRYEFVIDKV